MTYDYTCHNEECECEFEVDFTPGTPDRFMNGRMEDAIQGDPQRISPFECPECGEEVDLEEVMDTCE
jgi:hypothetical protein